MANCIFLDTLQNRGDEFIFVAGEIFGTVIPALSRVGHSRYFSQKILLL